MTVEEVANTILALGSGLMDAATGQVISVDHGVPLYNNVMRLYGKRDKLLVSKEKLA